MQLTQTIVPISEPITLAEAKLHLKVDGTDDDDLITALIATARQIGERETKRAFITQQWEMAMDSAPEEFEIPKPPLQRVISIKIISTARVETVVDPLNYYIHAPGISPGRVRLVTGCIWPTHRDFASFIVTFDAGYGDNPENVPEPLRQAILQVMGHLYDNRGSEKIPVGAMGILQGFRVYHL